MADCSWLMAVLASWQANMSGQSGCFDWVRKKGTCTDFHRNLNGRDTDCIGRLSAKIVRLFWRSVGLAVSRLGGRRISLFIAVFVNPKTLSIGQKRIVPYVDMICSFVNWALYPLLRLTYLYKFLHLDQVHILVCTHKKLRYSQQHKSDHRFCCCIFHTDLKLNN